MDDLKYVIVVGASAGGFNAITDLVARLPEDLATAVFVVMHLAKSSSSEIICQHFKKYSNYECRIPVDNERIQRGKLYFAPPDFHMLVTEDSIRLLKGPHENRYRPSIDVLFRSAAAAFGARTIGIILSGMLDDGTSGMSAIKRSGGVCIVQEPAEAAYSDMPENVLNNVEVDHRVPVTDMGYILDDIFSRPMPQKNHIPEDVKLETEITERMISSISDMEKLGTHSNYTCPDCGGGLWEIENDKFPRYRCHTGHVYTENTLMERQAEELEESVWVSIRMLEERRNLLLTLASRENDRGEIQSAEAQRGRAAELNIHIDRLKELMISFSKQKYPPDEGYL